jgi:sugar phosphate isomerase/epimerase
MSDADTNQRLAVCSWSLQPTDLDDLLTKLQATGINRVQLALDPLRDAPAKWQRLPQRFAELGVSIVSGMFGCLGEDYSTMETIRVTGGIAPDATWEQNRKNIQSTAAAAKALGLSLVTFHAGFLPHDPKDPAFSKMLARLNEVADIFERTGAKVGLETGQETASALGALLQTLNRKNVVVNFDPANMILYGKGDPVQGLRVLGRWIQQVHLKDGNAAKVPGTWGEEVPAGTGQVDWAKFFGTLDELNFSGPVVIEREAGNQRVEDIRRARQLAQRFLR